MSIKQICVIAFVVVALVASFAVPITAETGNITYPTSIAGYPVIFVQTPENTFGLTTGEVRLTVFVKGTTLDGTYTMADKVAYYIAEHPLPKGWSVETYGGPGGSQAEYERVHKENYEWQQKHEPIVFKMPSASSKAPLTGTGHSFAIDVNSDPQSYSLDAQWARWNAPQVGTSQSASSALLDNVYTNTSYFLQAGQLYQSGAGYNVWTDTTKNLVGQQFNVAYVVGDNYLFNINVAPGGKWRMECSDVTTYAYDGYIEQNSTGSTLALNVATSVFFENMNNNANWYSGFTNPISVYGAGERDTGSHVYNWRVWLIMYT